MKKVIATEKRPIKLWLNDIEEGALEQAKNMANLPFTYKHVSIMPDAHQGYGMPIGGVLATKGVVIPNAVGVDIGCGMCSMKTTIKDISTSDLIKIRNLIIERIPTGFNHQQQPQEDWTYNSDLRNDSCPIVRQEHKKSLYQLGTLGGGNHFIEIQKGSDGYVWVMIHSGSRNMGHKVATHYNKLAVKLNSLWESSIPKGYELAFLPIESKEARSYMTEMNLCVDFALANRRHMMGVVGDCFVDVLPSTLFIAFDGNTITNIAHNYAKWENHYGTNVVIHRKGATSAREGEIGIIPGSQGSSSFIVKGLGNKESFMSCSHGAGRQMGRKQAIRELNFEDEMKQMGDVIHGMESSADLDEATGAYKDINEVMDNQSDLVEILVELKPLAVIKG